MGKTINLSGFIRKMTTCVNYEEYFDIIHRRDLSSVASNTFRDEDIGEFLERAKDESMDKRTFYYELL